MKIVLTLIFSTILSITSHSQVTTCDCKTDLDFLVEKMKEMPSYKHQIRKQKKEAFFQEQYQNISQKMKQPISVYDCFLLLNEMMATVTDIHATVLSNTVPFSLEKSKDSVELVNFVNSSLFKNHPRTSKNLDLLKTDLQTRSKDVIEGIYNIEGSIVVGVYAVGIGKYEGAILESSLPIWQPGQLYMHIKKGVHDQYNVASYNLTTKKMYHIKSIAIENGRIFNLRKNTKIKDYSLVPQENTDWEYKALNENTAYVHFGTFSRAKTNQDISDAFYEEHKDNFNVENIIVDLRNNRGGSKKLSDPYYKLFKKSGAKIYILTNQFTGSNGEQFTVQLKKIKGAEHLGQTTRGIISYGFNYGRSYTTPSKLFNILPTDMDFHNKLFKYEAVGVAPEKQLDLSTSWIDQTLALIEPK